MPLLLVLAALATDARTERVLRSPRVDVVAIQLAGGRRRLELHGLEAGWQYEFGVSWARLWRFGESRSHLLGLRLWSVFPDLRGIELSPQLAYRWGDLSTVNLAWGPLWRIDEDLKGAGGYRAEVGITAGRFPWTFYFGVTHAVVGRPELAIGFGVRFEYRLYRADK